MLKNKFSIFQLFSPMGIALLLVVSLVFNIGPLFIGIEVFLLLSYLYRYVPAVIYMVRARSIKNKLRPLPGTTVPHKDFIVLVPAHNEADSIAPLVKTAVAQDYPREHYRVVVVADNCTDSTADIARAHGAECIEKNIKDPQPGKGACLAYASKMLQQEQLHSDTYFVIVDADCEVEPDYLSEINKRLSQYDEPSVLQTFRYVKNRNASVVSMLDAASENVRQLVTLGSRDLARMNAYLHGSGTVFEKSIFFRFADMGNECAAEDKEWNAWLLRDRIPIKWCPSAKLSYNVFEKNEEFQKQRVRWVRGQFITARKLAGEALMQGISRGSLSQIDYALSLYQLPRSVLIFFTFFCAIANYFFFSSAAWASIWFVLSMSIVPFELVGLRLSDINREFFSTGFKMIWGVTRSSLASSVNMGTGKFWTEIRGAEKKDS
ncbi:MAG: glycosyltransferase [Sphingobacteriales bacterium]|nr:MAG: glycosyltransferase [Sphingobacteriales bacterium]